MGRAFILLVAACCGAGCTSCWSVRRPADLPLVIVATAGGWGQGVILASGRRGTYVLSAGHVAGPDARVLVPAAARSDGGAAGWHPATVLARRAGLAPGDRPRAVDVALLRVTTDPPCASLPLAAQRHGAALELIRFERAGCALDARREPATSVGIGGAEGRLFAFSGPAPGPGASGAPLVADDRLRGLVLATLEGAPEAPWLALDVAAVHTFLAETGHAALLEDAE